MADDPREDGGETPSVGVELDIPGFKAGIKLRSRAVAAWDRLFGDKVTKKGLQDAADIRVANAEADSRVRLIGAATDLMIERMRDNPERAERALASFWARQERQQANKEAVAEIAYKELRRLPPPDAEEDAASSPELDEDWLNVFEVRAEQATSDRMRDLLGLILAGQIRRPGTFSLLTLDVASKLDTNVALVFQAWARRRFERFIPIVHSDASAMDEAELLLSFGLIVSGPAALTTNFPANNGVARIKSGQHRGFAALANNVSDHLAVPAVRLSLAGTELAALIDVDEVGAVISALRATKSLWSNAKV